MILVIALHCHICTGAPSFSAERLFVTTVIDTSSPSVIRDAHTFFRSLRIFGGEFNRAYFQACILVKKAETETPATLDVSIIEFLV